MLLLSQGTAHTLHVFMHDSRSHVLYALVMTYHDLHVDDQSIPKTPSR